MYKLKQPLEVATRKKVLLKFENIKGDGNKMIKIPRLRISGFLQFHIQGAGTQVLLNPWEILVKELFFNNISFLLPANAIKTKFLANDFQEFCLLFRNS